MSLRATELILRIHSYQEVRKTAGLAGQLAYGRCFAQSHVRGMGHRLAGARATSQSALSHTHRETAVVSLSTKGLLPPPFLVVVVSDAAAAVA